MPSKSSTKNKDPVVDKSQPPKKKRGRPKGSKNGSRSSEKKNPGSGGAKKDIQYNITVEDIDSQIGIHNVIEPTEYNIPKSASGSGCSSGCGSGCGSGIENKNDNSASSSYTSNEFIHPSLAILQGERKVVARNQGEQNAIDDIVHYFKDELDGVADVEPLSKTKRIPVILEEKIESPADNLKMTSEFCVGDTPKKLVIDQSFHGVNPESKYNVGGNNKNGIGELDPSVVIKTNSNDALQIKPGTLDQNGDELDEVMMYLLISKNINQKDSSGNDIFFYYHPRNLYTPNFHHPGTGPEQCNNCLVHGSFGCQQRIWLGYCLDCAFNTYRLTRGLGFVNGVEVTYDLWRDKFKEQIGDFHIRISDLFRYGMSNQGKIYRFIMKFDNFVDFSDDLPEPKKKNFSTLSKNGGSRVNNQSHGNNIPHKTSDDKKNVKNVKNVTNQKLTKETDSARIVPPTDYSFHPENEDITYLKNIKKYRDVNNEHNIIASGGSDNSSVVGINGERSGFGEGNRSTSGNRDYDSIQNKKLEPAKIELVNKLLKSINYSDLPNLQIVQDENGIGLSTQILGNVKTTVNGEEIDDNNKYSNMTPQEYNQMFEESFGKDSSRGKVSDNPNANINIFNNFIEAHRQSVIDFQNGKGDGVMNGMSGNDGQNIVYIQNKEIGGNGNGNGSYDDNMDDNDIHICENNHKKNKNISKKYDPELEDTYDFTSLTQDKIDSINDLVNNDDIIGLREYVDNGDFQLFCIHKQREKHRKKMGLD